MQGICWGDYCQNSTSTKRTTAASRFVGISLLTRCVLVLQLRYHEFLNKRHLVNPKKSGPFHHRAPSRILYKAIRGMVPHKVGSRLGSTAATTGD